MNLKSLIATSLICVFGSLVASVSPAQADPEAICVLWKAKDPDIPHFSYSGAQTRLKGIARGGATEYRWDFGDGSPSTAWATIGTSIDNNPYALEATHAYFGSDGQLFIATLYLRDGLGGESQDTYRVRLHKSSNLADPVQLEVRINMAIDEGLWWLHKNMVRSTFGSSAPGYGQPFGYWNDPAGYELPATATPLDAFQLSGHKSNGDYDGNPYVETVQRAMNFLLSNVHHFAISVQPHGDPDTNGNGIGLVANNEVSQRQTYIGGISMMALASSSAPTRVATVGWDYVYGRTYADIVQDMVDFFAYGQVDSGAGRGGWRYYANYSGSDMSTTQWPALGMAAAEEGMGSTVPQFVRDELIYFLDYTQHTTCDSYHGGFGYDYDINYPNDTKAAAGIICHEFLRTPLTDPKVESAIGYLYRHWNDTGGSWTSQRMLGNSYGMYAVMKAMRMPGEMAAYQGDYPDGILETTEYDCTAGSQTANSFDWFFATNSEPREGLAHYLVRTQHSDGSWDDVPGPNPVYDAFATGWRVMILLPVLVLPPVACISHCDELAAEWNQDIPLDGSCSYHTDPNRTIVSWDWDFDGDGTCDDATGQEVVVPGGFPATGNYPVTLCVEDDNPEGAQLDTETCSVWVHPPPHCPIADAAGPYLGWVGTATTFNGCQSWDPNGDILLYEWDLDGDGEFDDCSSDHPNCTCEWTCPGLGEWGIGLRVTDAGGGFDACSDTDFTSLDCDNHPPVCNANGPYKGLADQTITLDGCASYDPDPGDSITYEWDLDGDGTFDDCSECSCPFTVGSEIGHVDDVCLKVTDSFNEHSICCSTVTAIESFFSIDIKPGSCPNSWNRNSNGVLPVAILGTEDLDVTQIDVASVTISRADGTGGSVGPHEGPPGPHSEFEDVGTPFEGEVCDCHEAEGDGILDLSMKFKTQDVADLLPVDDPNGALVPLVVSGTLLDGAPFLSNSDCVRLVPPGSPPGLARMEAENAAGAWIELEPLDDQLDGGGFAPFERSYPQSTQVKVKAPARHNRRAFVGWRVDGGPLTPEANTTLPFLVAGEVHTLEAVYEAQASGCGLGAELALVVPPLLWLYRRRQRTRS